MNRLSIAGFVIALLAAAATVQAQEIPELPGPTKEHEWLSQLAGEWKSEVETFMVPGEPPLKSQGTESVRKIGGFWIQGENKGSFQGEPYTGILTLGYDTTTAQYVGTWVDSMTGILWKYTGELDEKGRVLTLSTEGPCPGEPGKTSKFREVLELKSPDHKVFTSFIQGDDGEWTKMMSINYRRQK